MTSIIQETLKAFATANIGKRVGVYMCSHERVVDVVHVGYGIRAVVCVYGWLRVVHYNRFGVLRGQSFTDDHTKAKARQAEEYLRRAELVLGAGPGADDAADIEWKWRVGAAKRALEVYTSGNVEGPPLKPAK